MRINTGRHLPRRTFLRGVGATLALPLLDSMAPAFLSRRAAAAAAPAARLGIVYVPNGLWMRTWTPPADGALAITPLLEPLASHRDRMVVLTGLANRQADALPGEGAGDHARAAAAYLSGIHPKKTEGADIRAGVSMDQIAARALGAETELASLELSLDSREPVGACDPGYSCAYANTLSWRTPTNPLPTENDPRVVFERLFGGIGSTDAGARAARRASDRSVLDAVTARVSKLRTDVGAGDSVKLDEYFEAIRDVERRIQRAEQHFDRELPAVDQPAGVPGTFEQHVKLMFDLQVLAYQADLTRVITFMIGYETSQRAYPEIGVPDAHHPLSHHGGDVEKIAKLQKVNLYHLTLFGYYLNRLATTADGDGSLLDRLTILYGSGMSDGNIHLHANLPALLVGGANGRLRGGRHLRYPEGTPITNLFVSLLDKLGVPTDTLGDSTGRLRELADL